MQLLLVQLLLVLLLPLLVSNQRNGASGINALSTTKQRQKARRKEGRKEGRKQRGLIDASSLVVILIDAAQPLSVVLHDTNKNQQQVKTSKQAGKQFLAEPVLSCERVQGIGWLPLVPVPNRK